MFQDFQLIILQGSNLSFLLPISRLKQVFHLETFDSVLGPPSKLEVIKMHLYSDKI
jgi:hypothetical protein